MRNALYYGDNLAVLRSKIASDSVDLCYIDPPFNSKRNYFQIYNNVGKEDRAQSQAFIDTWSWDDLSISGFDEILSNSQGRFQPKLVELIKGLDRVIGRGSIFAYLISMSLRVTEIHRALKATGSFYLHCDPTSSHYLKLVLDAIFCGAGGDFQNEIDWCYKSGGASKRRFSRKHDVLLFYTKSDEYTFNYQTEKSYNRGFKPYHFKGVQEFKDDVGWYTLVGMKDYWNIDMVGRTSTERLGYPTQKPEALLERIIKASSREDAVILDAYCGCGTTISVAEKLGRRWIGIDITYQSIALILKRLEDRYLADWPAIEATIKLDGVPRDLASAIALANRKDDRTRKEFEKWAVLTYSKNQARINERKGADAGIDGTAFFLIDKDKNGKAIFQVKSGGANRATMATLNSDRQREGAEFGILITMDVPTRAMREEVTAAGKYRHPLLDREDDRLQVVTVEDILAGKRLNLPMGRTDAVKSAMPVASDKGQDTLF